MKCELCNKKDSAAAVPSNGTDIKYFYCCMDCAIKYSKYRRNYSAYKTASLGIYPVLSSTELNHMISNDEVNNNIFWMYDRFDFRYL